MIHPGKTAEAVDAGHAEAGLADRAGQPLVPIHGAVNAVEAGLHQNAWILSSRLPPLHLGHPEEQLLPGPPSLGGSAQAVGDDVGEENEDD